MGKISSKLVRNIKGDGADVAFLHAGNSMNHIRSPSSFDLGMQESTEFSGDDQADEPLEKVHQACSVLITLHLKMLLQLRTRPYMLSS